MLGDARFATEPRKNHDKILKAVENYVSMCHMLDKVLLYSRQYQGAQWEFDSVCFGQEDIERRTRAILERAHYKDSVQIGYIVYQTGQEIRRLLSYDEEVSIIYGGILHSYMQEPTHPVSS